MNRNTFLYFSISVLVGLAVLLSLLGLLSISTVCNEVQVWCPDANSKFQTKSCCSLLWYSFGSALGMGNECSIDLDDMRNSSISGCPMYDCYFNEQTRTGWNSNGCSGVPNSILNENACDIHDLCYITPGSNKEHCDDKFEENIGLIYCSQVNTIERLSCSTMAHVAGIAVRGFSVYWDSSEVTRDNCKKLTDPWIPIGSLVFLLLIIFGAILCTNNGIISKKMNRPCSKNKDL